MDQYPLYSKSGEALFEAGDAYTKMGPRFRKQAGEMFARVVREYPLSNRAEDAKRRLEDLEMPAPQADPAAMARAKFEQENYHRPGLLAEMTGWMRGSPDVSHAAKSGQPTMTDPKRTIPASVPVVNTQTGEPLATGGGTTDVSATAAGSSSALDKNPDARKSSGTVHTAGEQTTSQALPTNRDKELKKYREQQAKKQAALEKKKKKNKGQQGATPTEQAQGQSQQNQSQATQGAQTPLGTANSVSTPAGSTAAPAQNPPPHQ